MQAVPSTANTCFNTQPPEGGWIDDALNPVGIVRFQHTAARRRLGRRGLRIWRNLEFQHTAARRRLGLKFLWLLHIASFNTQPPEGGWAVYIIG